MAHGLYSGLADSAYRGVVVFADSRLLMSFGTEWVVHVCLSIARATFVTCLSRLHLHIWHVLPLAVACCCCSVNAQDCVVVNAASLSCI